jgi:alpha-D-ribose 1-methylphosphonate 5-triphosphate diphosphatase
MGATLRGARVLWPDGVGTGNLSMAGGVIVTAAQPRVVDLSGFLVLPGIVDAHGDGFERHLAPRRGAMTDPARGLVAAEAELAASGITTAMLAQFYSWEGGLRGPDFAASMLAALAGMRATVATDLRAQLRVEVSMIDAHAQIEAMIAKFGIGYVVFNDHLPHDALAKGKRPPRLTGQALRIGRNPERHLEIMQGLHDRMAEVDPALDTLAAKLSAAGVRLGSHDDRTAGMRLRHRARGVRIAEFPETPEAAEAARAGGDAVIMGAPNVMRGGSHNGNAGAGAMVAAGCVDALASDYHYPSLVAAPFHLVDAGIRDLATAWALVSSGPARVLGLDDRGELRPGLRADLIVIDPETRRAVATIAGGRISYLTGEAAARFTA